LKPSYWGLAKKRKKQISPQELMKKAEQEVEDDDVHSERMKALDVDRSLNLFFPLFQRKIDRNKQKKKKKRWRICC